MRPSKAAEATVGGLDIQSAAHLNSYSPPTNTEIQTVLRRHGNAVLDLVDSGRGPGRCVCFLPFQPRTDLAQQDHLPTVRLYRDSLRVERRVAPVPGST